MLSIWTSLEFCYFIKSLIAKGQKFCLLGNRRLYLFQVFSHIHPSEKFFTESWYNAYIFPVTHNTEILMIINNNNDNNYYNDEIIARAQHARTYSRLQLLSNQPFPKQALVFTCLLNKSFENTVGKGEIACNEQFLLFPQCFPPIWRTSYHFHQT